MRAFRVLGFVVVVLLVSGTSGYSSIGAQRGAAALPPAREMTELLATLRDKALTLPKKQSLTRQVFSGEVDVMEVQDVGEPTPDRFFDNVLTPMPAKRIIVEVGAGTPYFLAFQTSDVARASTLRKGDKTLVSGQIVKLVQHKVGFNNRPDEWLIFDSVVLGKK